MKTNGNKVPPLHAGDAVEVRSLEEGAISPDDEQSYQKILQLLRGHSGLDLRQYKPETIRRRIGRRMLLLRTDHLANYLRFLQIRQDELRRLQEDVLINVTRFFRDPAFWESLRVNVLPVLMQDRQQEKSIEPCRLGKSHGMTLQTASFNVNVAPRKTNPAASNHGKRSS